MKVVFFLKVLIFNSSQFSFTVGLVLDCDYDALTYVEKCLRGEIKADRASWNTSGKDIILISDVFLILGKFNFN